MQMNLVKYNFSTLVMLRLQYSLLQIGDIYDTPNSGHWDNLCVLVDQQQLSFRRILTFIFHFILSLGYNISKFLRLTYKCRENQYFQFLSNKCGFKRCHNEFKSRELDIAISLDRPLYQQASFLSESSKSALVAQCSVLSGKVSSLQYSKLDVINWQTENDI